ncbi:Gag-Pol polyprotein/retrotransposon [Rhizoctonia solani]|uniref:Gag-Pol polyprotein/retrotransposon n=1 Tax=Rhizoctonia solani TaxID=456999 RepID=A0A8H8SRI4_9AGAM|nr:Gag-Pol polyprotein/retrotransposon [Rhizoctonia solani]QRW15624.1 Gag-Pol polyprotein/retrotransposon [Rhizoctonia solani]
MVEAFNTALAAPPTTFAKAMSCVDAQMWMGAMNKEYNLITDWKRSSKDFSPVVGRQVEQPIGRNVVECKWVFGYKIGPNGKILRYKVRLVTKGFSQRPGIDFEDTSSPVANSDSTRALLAKGTSKNYNIIQLNIKTAFLHGKIKEEIYMEQPKGFEDNPVKYVWRLEKALYGLKQAARAFYSRLRKVLEQIGFTRCNSNHAVFHRQNKNNIAFIVAHVDDMLLIGKPCTFLEEIKSEMAKVFELVNLGEPKMFAGVSIRRDCNARTLKILQERYIEEVLKRFDMNDCKPSNTPMAESPNLPKLNSPTVDQALYQRGIGLLMYAMVQTRPDIAYATGLLAQHSANPGHEHWNAFRRTLRYLKGTKDLGIVYKKLKGSELTGYIDADYAGDPNTSQSTTGWTFMIGGASIAWSSRKQPTISLSSTEAEYVAAASATRKLIWLRQFLSELDLLPEGPTTLLTNNQSSMALAKNPINHQCTKHIRIKHHFIREMIELKEVDLQYIPTNKQVADILTKPLGRTKLPGFVTDMGMS